MNILLYSDLHLEATSFIPDRADVLSADVIVLAGDIHEGTKAFRWARESFEGKAVVYVAGNHEYYGGHFDRTLDEMRAAARVHDIDFLECDAVELGGYRFLGTTLWTDFDLFGIERRGLAMSRAISNILDYSEISVSRTPETHWTTSNTLVPALTRRRHRASREWLFAEIKKGDPNKTIVVTHHAPSIQSVPQHLREDFLSACYASNLDEDQCDVAYWLHGHMHTSCQYPYGSATVVCNPRGVQDWRGGFENPNFNRACYLSFFDPENP